MNNQQIKKSKKTKPFQFYPLAPNDKIENIDDYNEWLKEITGNDKFGNIAITGDLGIGKSSIIKTFERKDKLKFIYLSASDLADSQYEEVEASVKTNSEKIKEEQNIQSESYESKSAQNKETLSIQDEHNNSNNDKTELTDSQKKESIQKNLEKHMLIQLIAMCKENDIPFSHFKTVPENHSKMHKFLWLFLYPFFSALTALCIFKFAIRGYLSDIFSDYSFNWILSLIIGLYIAFSIFGMVRMITKNYKLPKLSYKMTKGAHEASAEFEQKAIEPESLDSNLHEILYIIEQLGNKVKTKHKKCKLVLIIEDLDRYPGDICIPILKKFKQINDMLNQRYRQNNSVYGKHYKFIYILKDDIFSEENNTKNIWEKDPYKFFDIIIPIIPQFGFFNSSETIKKLFNDYEINSEFIDKISSYLYDYRKLNNIHNEYHIYQKQIPNNSLNNYIYTQLLAFVIYKVFYPQDYYELYKIHPKTNLPQSEFLKKILLPKNTSNNSLVVKDNFKEYLQSIIDDSLTTFMNFPNIKFVQLREAIIIEEKIKNLKGINLKFANLTDADLTDANLVGADLEDANLTGVNLTGANLVGADLEDANLTDVNLTGANLVGADLEGVNLTGANLIGANLIGANLIGASLTGASLINANLTDANLTDANLTGSDLTNANLTDANLTGANLTGSDLTNANLTSVILADADLRRTIIKCSILVNVTLKGVKLFESDLEQYKDYIRNETITIINPVIYEDENDKFEKYSSYTYNKNTSCYKLLK